MVDGLEAKLAYIEERQVEDRLLLRQISENVNTATTALAVLAEQLQRLDAEHEEHVRQERSDRHDLWSTVGGNREIAARDVERNRELLVRVLLVVLAGVLALAFALAQSGITVGA